MDEAGGSPPTSFMFGDGLDWDSSLLPTQLYVELPFWLMCPSGEVEIEWSGARFELLVCGSWREVFGGYVLDSRSSVIHHGPDDGQRWEPSPELAALIERDGACLIERPCKTVLRLLAQAHASAFRDIEEAEPPRAHAECTAYMASLCEAHIPVVNEFIQRYRLATYDPIPHEVSAWDVPVWYLKQSGDGYRVTLLPSKEWDSKPVYLALNMEDQSAIGEYRPFQFAVAEELTEVSSESATPGEFELLDAQSLMERGDYTGAVRRTVTAIEAVLRWSLLSALEEQHSPEEAERLVGNTDNNFPRRLEEWQALVKPTASQDEFDRLKETRQLRHEIVHRGRRLTHAERGWAQHLVDRGRWLFNKIERRPDREQLRERGTTLRFVGQSAAAARLPVRISRAGLIVRPWAPSEEVDSVMSIDSANQ